ncbi:MAG: DUF58 domain-containing protein [Thermoplasmata archaeon]
MEKSIGISIFGFRSDSLRRDDLGEIELSSRGKFFLILIFVMVAISVFREQPYLVVTAAFLFTIFFYSRFKLLKSSVKIEDRVSEGNKTVGEPFRVEHAVRGERGFDLVLSKAHPEEFEIEDENEGETELTTDSEFSYRLTPLSRGYHRLGKLEGWLHDPLDFYRKQIEHEIQTEVVVQSSKEAIRKAKTYSKHSYTEEFIEEPFAFTIRSNEIEGIREFQPGDSFKDIHWKSSSKFQKLMTRVYERMSPMATQILLDCSPSMRRRLPNGTTKLDHTIYVALQILKNFDLLDHDIGMTAYEYTDILFHQKPDSGKAVFRRLYERVSELPGSIEPYKLSIEKYESSVDTGELDEKEKRFSQKISQFSSIPRRDHISGILSAVDHIRVQGGEKKLVIIISDLEMQPQSTLKAVEHLKKSDDEVWIIVPFSPWYETNEIDEETLEKTYREYEKLENMLAKLERLSCSIFELYPDKEGIAILEEWGERKI